MSTIYTAISKVVFSEALIILRRSKDILVGRKMQVCRSV